MRLIAHRGNWAGTNHELENRPDYIAEAINRGYDAEIDLWHNDGLWLGHDNPQYNINHQFLEKYKSSTWIHAKNIDAVVWLAKTDFNWFWHQNDSLTLTSKGYVWTYPEIFVSNSVINQPADDSDFWLKKLWLQTRFVGLCHDDLERCKIKLGINSSF